MYNTLHNPSYSSVDVSKTVEVLPPIVPGRQIQIAPQVFEDKSIAMTVLPSGFGVHFRGTFQYVHSFDEGIKAGNF
jgi:hypothetical protein